jgi:hypothetical protein
MRVRRDTTETVRLSATSGSAVDVTERKLADEALSTLSQRLIEAPGG